MPLPMRTLLRLPLLLFVIFMAFPLHAQEVDDRAFITAALTDFATLDTYRFAGETLLIQEQTLDTARWLTRTTQALTGDIAGEASSAAFAVEQTITGDTDPLNWEVGVDRVEIDDVIYLRFRDLVLPPQIAEEAFDLPEGWFAAEPLPNDFATLSASAIGLLSFVEGYRTALVIPPILDYPLNDETVRSVERLDDEDLDGVTTRVYEVAFDAFGLYITHTREAWDSTFLNFETSGIDIARFFVEGGLQVRGRYWIDEAGRLAQVEQQIRLEVRPGTLVDQPLFGFMNDTRARVSFSDFNAPLEISAPE